MAGTERIDFASNATTGNGASKTWKGGKLSLFAEATWGGGSAKLQFQTPQGTWVDVPTATFSANSMVIVELPPGQYRSVIATATAVYMSGVTVPTITTR